MILTIQNGKPALVGKDGQVVLHSMYTGTRYWGTMYNLLKDYRDRNWTVRESEPFDTDKDFSVLGESIRYYIAECENSTLYAALGERDALIRTETRNTDGQKDPVHIITLGGMYARRIERVLCNGFGRYNGVRLFDMNSPSNVRIFAENDYCESAVHLPAVDRAGQAVNFGFVSFERHFGGVFACEGGTVEWQQHNDQKKLEADEVFSSDWMMLSFYDDMVEELPNYGRAIHDFNRKADVHTEVPSGFSSWYYYMGAINERMVFENLAKCDEIRDQVPLKVFQIDAGWEKGKYETNTERFPKGMKYYADLIREHGMTPGIWLAPFDFHKESPIVKDHPDWFVRNTEGQPVTARDCYMLDVFHPGAEQYVRDLYHRLTYDWGYRYLKIDIVSDFLTVGTYHDPSADSLQNLRKYFRLVRESVHPDTYILACTCPLLEVAEYVDGMRVAVDIFERWESLLKEFNRIFKRYYLNGTVYISDPDCLMIRKAENEDDDCRRFCSRNDDEIHTFLVAMYAAGGAMLISDKLPLMNDKQIEMYSRLFPVGGRVGKPLDLMESFVPGILDLGTEDGVRRVALINWGERERTFRVDLDGAYTAIEHFTDEQLGKHEGTYEVTLAPHCSQLVVFEKQ